MTPFQKRCIQDVSQFLGQRQSAMLTDFREVAGKTETYYVSKINADGRELELYIYVAQAGFYIDGSDWRICEAPDYDSEDELIRAFIAELDAEMGNS